MTRPSTRGASLLVALALAFGGCSTDSPTEPKEQPTPIGGGNTGTAAYNVQVSASPNAIEVVGEVIESFVTVLVRRANNNALPPDGAALVLTTTLGGFVVTAADGSETLTRSAVANLRNGRIDAILQLDGTQAGTVVVQAQIEQSFGQAILTLTEPPPEPEPVPPDPFFIEAINPTVGPPAGTVVQILGSGFSEPVRVLFGGNPGRVRSVGGSSIIVEAPPIDLPSGQVQVVSVAVTVNLNDTNPDDVEQTDVLANAFTYARGSDGGTVLIPKIFGLSPTSGPNEGGTRVVINGEGFADQVQVFFSSSQLIEVPVVSASRTQLVITTPAATGPNSGNLNQIVDVRVVNLDSGFETTSPSAFQYGDGQGGGAMLISSVGPDEGFYTGGDIVTITGQGFEEPVAVEFGSAGQQKISVTGTEIIARSVRVTIEGCQEQEGPFVVTNIETGESVSAFGWTYRVFDPIPSSLTPSSVNTDENGNLLAPATVMIGGSGFDPPVAVFFGDQLAFNATLDAAGTTVTAEIPPFTGEFETEQCDDNGDGTSGERLLPTAVNVRLVNLPSDCEFELVNRFRYNPPTECMDDVAPLMAAFVSSVNNLTVSFTDTSTGSPTSWDWDFGDGTGSTSQNPSHTYAPIDATYTVRLTVMNGSGSSTTTEQITIDAP